MINLNSGTNSVCLSLRESLPYGWTQSTFKLTFTQDVRGITFSQTITDSTPDAKWTNFEIAVGSTGLNMLPGMYSYVVVDLISSTTLEIGKARVHEYEIITAPTSPNKNTVAAKR